MSLFSDYSSSSEMHNNLTIDYYLALSSTKGSGITNIISIILQQAQDYDVNHSTRTRERFNQSRASRKVFFQFRHNGGFITRPFQDGAHTAPPL